MNFALLLTGQERTFEKCFPSIQKHILAPYSPDVFICVDANQELRFRELHKPVSMHFVLDKENRDAIGNSSQKYTNKAKEADVEANVSLFWKWRVCWDLLERSGRQYDVVFMARPDIWINSFDCPSNIDENIIYLPSTDALGTRWTSEHEYYGGWGGQLVFGSMRVAEVASKMYDHLDEIYKTYEKYPHSFGAWHTERNFKRWMCVMNHIDMSLFDIDFHIVRPEESC